MTIATESTAELSINRIVLHAFRKAGLMGMEQQPTGVQWERRATHAREVLEYLTKELETEGRLVRARRFYNLTLVASQANYTLPESIMDVYGDAAFIGPDEADVDAASFETLVRQVSMEEWQRQGTRQAEGRPVLYFAYRAANAIEIRLWPTPDALNAGTLRFQTYVFLANATGGGNTMDLERHWTLFLVTALAGELAEAGMIPDGKVTRLKQEAMMCLQKAKAYSRQRTNNHAFVAHRTGWSR